MLKTAYEQGCRDAMEKIAGLSPAAFSGIGALGLMAGGVGALAGHEEKVNSKLRHALVNKEAPEDTFIRRHPALTGALSLGMAPAFSFNSANNQVRDELYNKNKAYAKVVDEHPFLLRNLKPQE